MRRIFGLLGTIAIVATIFAETTGGARGEEYRFLLGADGNVDWPAECRRRVPIAIGMDENDVALSKWGQLQGRQETVTATGTVTVWTRETGPLCNDDGTVRQHGLASYLTFVNGHLVAITRRQ